MNYYSTILEINTSSPSGEVIDLLDLDDPEEILQELKKNKDKVINL